MATRWFGQGVPALHKSSRMSSQATFASLIGPTLVPVIFLIVSVSQFGCLASQSLPAHTAPSTGGSGARAVAAYTLDTPIELIAADPGGAAVLNKNIPGLLTNQNYSAFKAMSLKWLASMARGKLSQQTLAQTQADLDLLRK